MRDEVAADMILALVLIRRGWEGKREGGCFEGEGHDDESALQRLHVALAGTGIEVLRRWVCPHSKVRILEPLCVPGYAGIKSTLMTALRIIKP